MPNNCSTLIQRKQNILHKILRSNSDGKLENAVAETTAELCVSGTRKTPAYSPSSSTHHLSMAAATSSTARRSNLFASNRIQPSSNHFYDAHLPSIRDSHGSHDFQVRVRTPGTNNNNNSKNTGRLPSASISSIFNVLAKRSTENFASVYGDYEEANNTQPVPPSRRSQRPHKMNGLTANLAKQTVVTQKYTAENGNEIRFSHGSTDANQQRNGEITTRYRSNAGQTHLDSSPVQNSLPKERTQFGPLYQRRQNNSIKTTTKQKIDKYRRRSEEVTQAMNGTSSMNNSFNTTTQTAANSTLNRSKPTTTSSPIASIHHIPVDDNTNNRFEVLRLSMDPNLLPTDQPKKSQSQQQARNNRVKSPYLYSTQQQIKPATPVLNPPVQSVRLRRSHTPTQQESSVNSSQHQNIITANEARSQQQQPVKISANASPGNLYLAFIASRHVSSIEDALLESDIDHQKLLRIFTWLKNVEDHRHEYIDHDQLLIEQNERMLEQEDNLSLYSEIQHAVDDLPANTAGKPCEKIATMQFED